MGAIDVTVDLSGGARKSNQPESAGTGRAIKTRPSKSERSAGPSLQDAAQL